MKTYVEGANLSALAAKAAAHYEGHSLVLPDHCEERTFHIHDGTTGRNVQIQATDAAALLERKPLRVRYSTQSKEGRLLEVVLLAQTPTDALRLASALVKDLGVAPSAVTIIKEGTARFHVVAAGLFRGLDAKDAGRLLAYLQPNEFSIPNGRTTNGHQRHYQDHIDKTVATWKAMPAPALEEHLRKKTDLGAHTQAIIDFLATQSHAAASLGSCPPLLEYARKAALRATFPPLDIAKPLANPLVPVAGSIWLPAGLVAQAITVGGST